MKGAKSQAAWPRQEESFAVCAKDEDDWAAAYPASPPRSCLQAANQEGYCADSEGSARGCRGYPADRHQGRGSYCKIRSRAATRRRALAMMPQPRSSVQQVSNIHCIQRQSITMRTRVLEDSRRNNMPAQLCDPGMSAAKFLSICFLEGLQPAGIPGVA